MTPYPPTPTDGDSDARAIAYRAVCESWAAWCELAREHERAVSTAAALPPHDAGAGELVAAADSTAAAAHYALEDALMVTWRALHAPPPAPPAWRPWPASAPAPTSPLLTGGAA